jgi:hypothetical protein
MSAVKEEGEGRKEGGERVVEDKTTIVLGSANRNHERYEKEGCEMKSKASNSEENWQKKDDRLPPFLVKT